MYAGDSKIENIAAMVEDNNRILKRMQRGARWARFFALIKWVIILAVAGGTYYYFQPMIDSLRAVWPQLQEFYQNLPSLLPG